MACVPADDTLVLTRDADTQGLKAAARLCQELCPDVDALKVVQSWRVRFVSAPWDPAGQVLYLHSLTCMTLAVKMNRQRSLGPSWPGEVPAQSCLHHPGNQVVQ